MWSVLGAAWRMVARRALSDWAILVAAFITILLATVLIASGPIYAEAVTTSALRRTLADAEVSDANLAITTRVTQSTFTETDGLVSDELARAFSITGGVRLRRGSSESFAVDPQPGQSVSDLFVFRFFDEIDEHATVVGGRWPQAAGLPREVAINEEAAIRLGLAIGDEFDLTSRLASAAEVQVQVVGIYQVDDLRDAYWFDEELDIYGVAVGVSFTSFGPLVVPPETFFEITRGSSEMQWRVFPDYDTLTASNIADLRQDVVVLEERLNRNRELDNLMRVETRLGQILEDMERSLLATRSTTLILTVQLAVLAGYALLLTAGLLAESRQVQTNLLRSRGASNAQLLAMAVMEGTLLAVPAALAAPGLAALTLRSFNHVGPLAGIGLTISPGVTPSSYVLAAMVAVVCITALSVPTYRSARRFGSVRAERARQVSAGFVQRAGVDIALLVAAGLGFIQLRRYGAPITETVQGRLGIDPLLVAAPALGLLAGGVFALRMLPLLSRVAEAVTSRSARLVPALGAWQVGRRPRRYSRAALLLMLATGIGFFSVSYATTWRISQSDQAGYDVGAELRVEPDARGGSAIPYRVLGDAYDDLPGFEEAAPVIRASGRIPRTAPLVRYVIIDAARAVETIDFRADLAEDPIDELLENLTSGRTVPEGVPLPGEPFELTVEVAMEVDPLPDDFEMPPFADPSRWEVRQNLRVFLLDGDGQILRIDLGRVPATGGTARISAELGHTLRNGERLYPSYPLSVVALEVYSATPDVPRDVTLRIGEVSTRSAGGSSRPVDLNLGTWQISVTDPLLTVVPPSISATANGPGDLQLDVMTGSTASNGLAPAFFTLRPSVAPTPGSLPILVSRDFADELGLDLGTELPLDTLPRFEGSGLVVGFVEDFPTVSPESGEPVVLDYQTYLAATFEPGFVPPAPDEFWLAVDDESEEATAAVLRAAPLSSAAVTSRAENETSRQSDPVALGTIGSLLIGFVAAAVFAGIGFAVNVAVSSRQRLVEFALMRAVGLSRRQLIGWLTLENAILAVFGLLGGAALGLLLASLSLPLIAVTQEATRAVPDVIVVYPWLTIVELNLAVIAMVVAAVGLLAVMLRRMGLGALLRLGEE